jgi:hypothetical protein
LSCSSGVRRRPPPARRPSSRWCPGCTSRDPP